ncbi:CBASS cGAMP synthase [Tritonibacter scottomollicae]|uniref:CBASS cGAMP synthase n=1 Tax=Tritonibacter scottomollicae TaxID=483013 RepID=UPI003AA97CDF
MTFMARASALFVGLRLVASYHQALKVSDDKTAQLKSARRDIRNAIRAAGSRIKIEDRYWEQQFAQKSSINRPDVAPKFFTQGSFAYDLLVNPCHPAQQLDLDDGMYVIVDYLKDGRPALVAKSLFAMVEEALKPLCEDRGWSLNTSKQTCVRVEITSDAHIDIPIYSAPRDVAESQELALSFAEDRIAKRAGREYYELPSDKIMLAQRDGTWQQSDPLKLHKWVEACAERYGEDFRRACRYFKGWRDHTWSRCCLSSITIMVAVAEALEQLYGAYRGDGDDRLVYEVGQLLPDILSGTLYNPALTEEQAILNDWSDEDREAVVAAARALADQMDAALKRSPDQTMVVSALRKAFGERIPMRPDVVEILPPVTAAVAAAKPATVPSPSVTKSTSG